MSQTLILEVSDEVYTALQRRAEAASTSPAHLAATLLERQFGALSDSRDAGRPQTVAGREAARERFERHFGAVNLSHATGADNDSIDSDLAREYADTHEQA